VNGVYHAIRGLRFDEMQRADAKAVREAIAKVQHLYTIGSPLEKIRFFWPSLMPSNNLAGDRSIAWDNFASWFDPVAGLLRKYTEWGGVQNHRLLGGGFIRGHIVYEHSPAFLAVLTHGLCGKPLSLERSFKERLMDFMILLSETVITPAAVIVMLVLGLSVCFLAIILIPLLVSRIFLLFYPPETVGPIWDLVAAVVVLIVVGLFLIGSYNRAGRAQMLFCRHHR
jgi:hypothetical protein